ncbi:LOW QUALITY PROTEIN: bcl-2-related protein A1 [Cricetulus griseus]|uniref:Bcl-2-related protein A1 n=2 Tax=Cricetulus griseus TaxID=10029 RepID=A0A9J7FUJ5_CRIGR|nr:LOW QUALITY PROTEIN: bcl-2-related protein A1 [Cricetulus griseus]XP_027266780.1 LOW QUALITY PROTEIN: bcl-2-related protein A1 [Cricetulus griseus]
MITPSLSSHLWLSCLFDWTWQLQSALPRTMTDCEFMYIHSLAEDYLQYVLKVPTFESAPSKTSRVLQRVASSVQKEVEKNLKLYLDDFDVRSIDTARTIFNQVMEKEFEDGIINWGRIVTVFAFGGVLLKKLAQEQIGLDVGAYKQVSNFVAEFIMNNTAEWIRQNGGWEDGFMKKFEPKSGWVTFLETIGQIWEMLFLLKQHYWPERTLAPSTMVTIT